MILSIRCSSPLKWGKKKIVHLALATGFIIQMAGVGVAQANNEIYLSNPGVSEENLCHDLCLINGTEQPLVGEWHWQRGSSIVEIVFEHFTPNEKMERSMSNPPAFYKLYTWGRLCFEHRWWNLPRDAYDGLEYPVFSFIVQKAGTGQLQVISEEYKSRKPTLLSETDPC